MLSFYGGPNGQSFNIRWVFSNRFGPGNSMEADLSMGWASPIAVNDFVVISYGLPGDDSYEELMKQDLNLSKMKFNSTLWQKIYDENDDTFNGLNYRLIMSMLGTAGTKIFIGEEIGYKGDTPPYNKRIDGAEPGDLYLNSETGKIYILNKNGIWIERDGSLKGPVGDSLHIVRSYTIIETDAIKDSLQDGVDYILDRYKDADGNAIPLSSDEIFGITWAKPEDTIDAYLWKECQDKIEEVYSDITLTEQEREQKVAEIREEYASQINFLEISYWYFYTDEGKWGRVQITGEVSGFIESKYNSEADGPVDNKAYSISYINQLMKDFSPKDSVTVPKGGRIELPTYFGEGPYIFRFTEETEGGSGSGGGAGDSFVNIDPVPAQDSGNPVASGGVYQALQGKQDALVGAPGQILSFDAEGNPAFKTIESLKEDLGSGIPDGGTAGQALIKKSSTNQDIEWKTLTASDVGAVSVDRKVNGKTLGSDITLTASDIGALTTGDTAATATKLAVSRTIQTNLTSTSAASFDGTADVTPGVTGILSVANGGTGKNTALITYGTTDLVAGSSNLATGCIYLVYT